MRKKPYFKIVVYLLGVIVLAQALYSLADAQGYTLLSDDAATDTSQADGASVVSYEGFLSEFDVHVSFKAEIEKLVQGGAARSDVMAAYDYLYHEFGALQDLKDFAAERAAGESWRDIFAAYVGSRTPFIPQAFDPDDLEGLRESGLSPDDIMIADRVSHAAGVEVGKIIAEKQASPASWKAFNAQRSILFSAGKLPRVQVTAEQLAAYAKETGWTEDRVVEAFVLADRVKRAPKEIIAGLRDGLSPEDIYIESYVARYGTKP